jgi:hypothetical protein
MCASHKRVWLLPRWSLFFAQERAICTTCFSSGFAGTTAVFVARYGWVIAPLRDEALNLYPWGYM